MTDTAADRPDVLVLGATGTVGSRVVRHLVDAGLDPVLGVTSVDETSPRRQRMLDLGDRSSLAAAFEDIGSLFVLLPIHEQMVRFAEHVIAEATEAGVGHVVRSSAAHADPSSAYPLLRVHGEIDAAFEAADLDVAVLRPTCFMQSFTTFIGQMIRSRTVYASTGTGRSGWIDAGDIAACASALLLEPGRGAGRTFDLTGPETFSLAEGAGRISAALGEAVEVVDISVEAGEETLLGYGMPRFDVEMISSMERAASDGVFDEITGDVEELTGRAPTPFATFVDEHLDAWR